MGVPLVAIIAMSGSEASQLCGRWMLEDGLLQRLNEIRIVLYSVRFVSEVAPPLLGVAPYRSRSGEITGRARGERIADEIPFQSANEVEQR